VSLQASALLLAWAAILFLALAMTGLIRQVRYLSDRLEDGSPSNGVSRRRTSSVLRAGARPPGLEELLSAHGRPLGIVFASDACPSCEARLDELREVMDDTDSLIVVRRRPLDGRAAAPSGLPFPEVHSSELFDSFHVAMTPTAFAVGGDGAVADSVPLGSKTAVEKFTAIMKEL
jgi:hypothetical protein